MAPLCSYRAPRRAWLLSKDMSSPLATLPNPIAPPVLPLPSPPTPRPRTQRQAASLSDRLVHLCNHSVQKEQNQGAGKGQDAEAGEEGGGSRGAAGAAGGCAEGSNGLDGSLGGGGSRPLPSGSQGNMWTAEQLRQHLRERFQASC